MAGMPRKEVDALLKHVESQGARLEEKKSGTMIFFPDGSTAMAHFSTSDTNAFRPLRAAVKRAGLTWPGDHTDHGKKAGVQPSTLKAIRKAFYDNGYKPMALHEIVAATGLSQPTISRAAAGGEMVKVKFGVWKLPEVVPAPPEPVSETPAPPEPEPEPEYPNIEHATRLLSKMAKSMTAEEVKAEEADVQADIQRHLDAHKTVDFIDDRDSWTVDLHKLSPTMTVKDLFDTYVAAGLSMEIRVWKEQG